MTRADVTGESSAPRVLAGRYRLVGMIARGGMAEVFEGHDDLLARSVAVKIPLAHLADQAAFLERFRREAIAAARLSHPNVVSIYDTGTDGTDSFIVMELVRGPSLRQVLAREGPRGIGDAVSIATQVAAALDFAHRAGVVHRDIKPANILVTKEGAAKVADFGIAKAGEDATVTMTTVGTARYLSPEVVEGRRPDGRADIYSLGVVLYEMLCGQPPFDAENELAVALKHVNEQVRPPSEVFPSIPGWLEKVVLMAMAKDPARRFATAGDMRQALLEGRSTGTFTYFERRPPPRQPSEELRAPANERPAPTATLITLDTDGAPPGSALTAKQPAMADRDRTFAALVDDGPPPGAKPRPAPSREANRRLVPWVVGLISLAALAVGIFLAVRLGDQQRRPAAASAGTPTTVRPTALPATGVQLFDPDGDGSEDRTHLPNLIDNQIGTYWSSEQYATEAFGNLKPGIGLIVQLNGSQDLSSLNVLSATTGWDGNVYVADGTPTTLQGWGGPVASRAGVGSSTSFNLGGKRGSSVLLWVTRLGPDRVLKIDELSVRG